MTRAVFVMLKGAEGQSSSMSFGSCSIWWCWKEKLHWFRLSNMNVVVPLCFASHRLLCVMLWTFHVLRLSNGLGSSVLGSIYFLARKNSS